MPLNVKNAKSVKFENKIIENDVVGVKVEEDVNLSFRDMLKMHEETIIRFVEATVRTVSSRIDDVIRDVQDLKSCSNFQENLYDEKVRACDERIANIEDKIKQLSGNLNASCNDSLLLKQIKDKVVDPENRSRRNNLRIDGIRDAENESWKDTEVKLKNFVKNELKLDSNKIEIQRAHRVGKFDHHSTRCIVAKLLNWKDKESIATAVRKYKPVGVFINDDYAEETIKKRKELLPLMKKAREEGKYAVINVDKLVIRERRDESRRE